MARPSKTQQFTIHRDAGIPSPDPSYDPLLEHEDAFHTDDAEKDATGGASVLEGIEEAFEPSNIDPTDTEREDERRESAITSASISSLPESSSETDQEHGTPIHTAYSPQMIRPSFRRPESVRRMQMSSPTASFDRSPRRSVLHARSRVGTPRSNKDSPAMKKRHEEEVMVEGDKKEYPLILLHVTLLSVQPRWSTSSMQEVLPESVLEDCRLLRSKVSETVAQRGLLILHPRDDYELLEERLLESLELKEERITKCGHFRAQGSISSISSSEESTDSAMGSSIASSSVDVCNTCHRHVEGADSGNGPKWSIRVFAANGLMRASAWSAAWSEMERVDVEILPWISDELRRTLDNRAQAHETRNIQRNQDEGARVEEAVEERFRGADETRKLANEEAREPYIQEMAFETNTQSAETMRYPPPDDLPAIYPRKDIPLSILLRNYIYLLAQDKRNIAIFGLAALALWMSLRTALISTTAESMVLPTVYENGHHRALTSDIPTFDMSGSSGSAYEPTLKSTLTESTKLAATAMEETAEPLSTADLVFEDGSQAHVGAESVERPKAEPGMSMPVPEDISGDNDSQTCENPASTMHLFNRGVEHS